MVTIEQIRDRFKGNICRKCINKAYKVNLSRGDCHYYYYPHNCSCCKDMKNIVAGFTVTGKLKMLFK